MKYQAPYGVTDPNASYINGNPSTGTQGSIPPAAAFEEPMRELVNCLTQAGLTPTDLDLGQVWKALQLSPWLQETANDTGAANAYVASIASVPPQLYPGMSVRVKIANANTGASTFALNAFGAHTIKRANGAAVAAGDLVSGQVAWLVFDGSAWQIANYQGGSGPGTTNNFVLNISYAVDSGAANALVGSFTPTVATLGAGEPLLVKVSHTNTGAVTLKADTTATTSVVWPDGTALAAGDIVAGGIILVVYDGTNYQLLCRINRGGSGGSGGLAYAADTGTVNALIGAFTPTVTSLAAGTALLVKVLHTNTGATILTADSNPSKAIVWADGTALAAGDIVAGGIILVVYDGTQYQLIYNSRPKHAYLRVEYNGWNPGTGVVVRVPDPPTAVDGNTANFSPEVNQLGDSTYSGGQLTMGTRDAGLWLFTFNSYQKSGFNCDFAANIAVMNISTPTSADYSAQDIGYPDSTHGSSASCSMVARVNAGQNVVWTVLQYTSSGPIFYGELSATRLGD